MSGVGFLSSHCFTVPVKTSAPNVRNGRFLPQKYTATTVTVRAKVVERHRDFFPELMIKDVPYIDEAVERQSRNSVAFRGTETDLEYPEEAYQRCRIFCAEREKMVELGARMLPKEQLAAWALYAWCRRLDDLVDCPDDDNARSASLDEWEERIEDIFNGHPHDILDAAFIDTLARFPLDIKLFQDMIKGMRMDTIKSRYANFEELFLYSYLVTGTASLMVTTVVGIPPELKILSKTLHDAAVYFGIATQLTNILKEVSDDAQLGRVYLPQDELAEFGLCDEDIFSRKVTDEWKEFMKKQIRRARFYYSLAEQGIGSQIDNASVVDKKYGRKVWSILMGYRETLDEIEENDYDNLTKKALNLAQKWF